MLNEELQKLRTERDIQIRNAVENSRKEIMTLYTNLNTDKYDHSNLLAKLIAEQEAN